MNKVNKNRLTKGYGSTIHSLNSLVQTYPFAKQTVVCEICGKNEVLRKAHFRCHFCNKFTCSECAHYQAVFLREPLSMRVRSMRTCPNCKIKSRFAKDLS